MSSISNVSPTPAPYVPTTKVASKPAATPKPAPAAVKDNDGDNDGGRLNVTA